MPAHLWGLQKWFSSWWLYQSVYAPRFLLKRISTGKAFFWCCVKKLWLVPFNKRCRIFPFKCGFLYFEDAFLKRFGCNQRWFSSKDLFNYSKRHKCSMLGDSKNVVYHNLKYHSLWLLISNQAQTQPVEKNTPFYDKISFCLPEVFAQAKAKVPYA